MRSEPVLDVKAIYHRNDPILLGCPPQRPPEEQARYRAVMRSALLKQEQKKTGLARCRRHVVPRGGRIASAHRRIDQAALSGACLPGRTSGGDVPFAAYADKYVIVVDDDIDVSNLEELIWAVCCASTPATSIDFSP